MKKYTYTLLLMSLALGNAVIGMKRQAQASM